MNQVLFTGAYLELLRREEALHILPYVITFLINHIKETLTKIFLPSHLAIPIINFHAAFHSLCAQHKYKLF